MHFNLGKAIWNDWWLFLALLFVGVFAIAGVSVFFQSGGFSARYSMVNVVSDDPPAWFMLVGALASAGAFLLRLFRIELYFKGGSEARAVITGKSFYRGRGRVTYRYAAGGAEVSGGNALRKSGDVNALQVGDAVTVLVHPDGKHSAIIKGLYLRAPERS